MENFSIPSPTSEVQATADRELADIDSLLAGYEAVARESGEEDGGRKKKEPRPRVAVERLASKDDIKTAFVQLTDFLSLRLGPHWKAQEEEAEHVAKSWAAFLDRLGPDIWDSTLAAGIIAGSSLVLYALPRVFAQIQVNKEIARQETAGAVGVSSA